MDINSSQNLFADIFCLFWCCTWKYTATRYKAILTLPTEGQCLADNLNFLILWWLSTLTPHTTGHTPEMSQEGGKFWWFYEARIVFCLIFSFIDMRPPPITNTMQYTKCNHPFPCSILIFSIENIKGISHIYKD